MKIASIIIMIVGYVLLIMAPTYALRLAKKKHGTNLKDVKNEVKGGFVVRGLLSLVYYFAIIDWMGNFQLIPWAYIPYHLAINITGIILLVCTVALFWWIHIVLGANYHGPMKLHDNHALVTTGPYAIVRHPTYIAFPLMHISLTVLTGNYLIAISGIIMAVIVNTQRVKVEERLLEDRFKNDYLDYKSRVGKYFPHIFTYPGRSKQTMTMKKTVEIRSYVIKENQRDEFHRLVSTISYPLMKRWGINVVAFGPSLHDGQSYFLIRAYDSEPARISSQDLFYASDDWRKGPREAIIALIESDANVVMEMDESIIARLRKEYLEEG